jgi:LacI family transcriptional regulator, gluconate utilization system Gnt-I transcriptional repressor
LASSRTRLVAAVIPEISQSLFASTIQSLCDTLADTGYGVMLGLTGAHDQYVDQQVLSIIGRRPEGIILTGPTLSLETRRRLKSSEITTIGTWDLPAEPIDLVVGFSHEAVGRAVAVYALKTGRRRAFVASASGVRALARRYGFAKAMMEGGAAEPTAAAFATPTTYRYGRTAVAAHLDSGGRPDIIVCSSDWSAHGALDELRSRNVRVPDDVAVIGFGDLEFASDLQPSLTTIKIDGHVIGLKAAQFLLRRMQGQRIEDPVADIGFTLVRRDSA